MQEVVLRPSGLFNKGVCKLILERKEANKLMSELYEGLSYSSIAVLSNSLIERLLNTALKHNTTFYFKFEIKGDNDDITI